VPAAVAVLDLEATVAAELAAYRPELEQLVRERQCGGGGVAAQSCRAPALGVVGECSTGEASHTGETIGDPFDEAKGSSGRTERRRQEARQKRRRHFMSEVGEEACAADTDNTASEPGLVTTVIDGCSLCGQLRERNRLDASLARAKVTRE
jgi:outer membrane cobalamin receptor